MNKKTGSKGLSLATVSILGQPPSIVQKLYCVGINCVKCFCKLSPLIMQYKPLVNQIHESSLFLDDALFQPW